MRGQCKNSSNHLYSVPKDENKRKLWMDAVRKYLPDGAFICSKHFPIHFIGEKKLLKGAKPSCILQLDYPVEKTPFET
ncbi:uncharacterized protein isoform X4 [Leptinotarsa decemlineata]|uniref:uncharacterized protein isoform X4 n=1 Tax=Leptinotarsa decemlineata TaxID=7539 RepID=UPI003D3063CA